MGSPGLVLRKFLPESRAIHARKIWILQNPALRTRKCGPLSLSKAHDVLFLAVRLQLESSSEVLSKSSWI